ncbi:MAG: CAP domain-containing protein, partial [Clostridiales bacterium]|nr:CAP domain-containing protein [Clostridiales bacterium]
VLAPTPINISSYERRVLELVNIERANNGLNPLAWHDGLANVARAHSEDLARNNMTGHTGSDGSSPGERITRAGITDVSFSGENAYAGPSTSEAAVIGWMNSPGHRDNILNPNHTHLGVGVAHVPGSTFGFYWTQKFGR